MKMIILMFAAIFSFTSLAVDPCTDPFAADPTQFYLVSPLYCGPTDHYKYWISSNNDLPNPSAGYLDIVCIDNAKATNLYMGNTIIDFSNPIISANWEQPTISNACNGNTLFSSNTATITYQGQQFSVNNNINQVQINAVNGTILASAIRTLIPNNHSPLCATTTWQIQNAGGLPGAVMSFFLSFKDNTAYVCPVNPPPTPENSNSVVIVIAIAVSVITAAIVSATGIIYYFKHQLKKEVSALMQNQE